MIELLYECDGLSPFDNSFETVTGLQVFHRGTFVQILEGPEADVWAAFDALGGTSDKVIKTDISRRSLATWNSRLTTEDILPRHLKKKLGDFAALAKTSDATDPGSARTDTAKCAVAMLTGMEDSSTPGQTIAGAQSGALLSGRSGKRAWVAV